MNIGWAVQRLTDFRDACVAYDQSVPRGGYGGDDRLRDRMYSLEPTARKIMAALDLDLARFQGTEFMGGPHQGAMLATRGLGVLADMEEVERNLRPAAPVLPADELHPWVWSAASTFWDAGAYLVAVEQAAKSVNVHTQQKLGVADLADDDLQAQAWSNDPPKADRPRLRVRGDHAEPTVRSRQSGARALGQACYRGIRNVAAHTPDDGSMPRQHALEMLATFSVLARWIDDAEVVAG